MLIVNTLKQIRAASRKGCVCTIGNFDGIHAGHRTILRKVRSYAAAHSLSSLVITFTRARGNQVMPPKRLLTSFAQKMALLEREGIDLCYLFSFTQRIQELTPEYFLEKILFKHFNIKALIIGYDFRFGKNRAGTIQLLKTAAEQRGIAFYVVPAIKCGNHVASSSRIRALVETGLLAETTHLLGRRFSFFAEVIRGAGRGKKLGFPTANLKPLSEILPPCGVYIVSVTLLRLKKITRTSGSAYQFIPFKKHLKGVLNIGFVPTFKEPVYDKPQPEVFLIDFSGSVRGLVLEVILGKKIRNEREFSNESALKQQIRADIAKAKKYQM